MALMGITRLKPAPKKKSPNSARQETMDPKGCEKNETVGAVGDYLEGSDKNLGIHLTSENPPSD